MQTRQEINTPLTISAWHSCYEALRTLLSKETFGQEYLKQLESIKCGIEETLRKKPQTTYIHGYVFTPQIESLQKLYDALIEETEAVELKDLSTLIQTFLIDNPRIFWKINPNDISNGTYIIPFGVTCIAIHAFDNCRSLASIKIPPSVTKISIGAFQDCTALTSITIPASVTSIDHGVFRGCTALTSITIPPSVIEINKSAFENCTALTSITIPAGLASIDSSAFEGCTALASVRIPDSVTKIGNFAFKGCTALASVRIPDSVTSIDTAAFSGCTSLTTIRIPAPVTSIDIGAFSGCTSLTTISIPASVTSIHFGAFANCPALTTIIIDANNQQRYEEILSMLPPNLRAIANLSAFKERFVTTMVNERKGYGFFGSKGAPGEVTGIILSKLSKTYGLAPIDELATGKCVSDNITASLVP